jgi:hypothetical protein
MTNMLTTSKPTPSETTPADRPVSEAPGVQAAQAAHRAAIAAREQAVARAARCRSLVNPMQYGPATDALRVDLVAQLEAKAELPEAERQAALARAKEEEARRHLDAVTAAEGARIRAARAGRDRELLQAWLDALTGAPHEAERAHRAYRAETARLLRLTAGADAAPSVALIIAVLQHALHPPGPPAPAPRRSNEVEVRVLAKLHAGLRFLYPGDTMTFPPDIAADLIKRQIAEPVPA